MSGPAVTLTAVAVPRCGCGQDFLASPTTSNVLMAAIASPYSKRLQSAQFTKSRCRIGWRLRYLHCFRKLPRFLTKSLDEAFNIPPPKGHLAALRKKDRLAGKVLRDVNALLRTGRKINAALFEEVGARHALGENAVRGILPRLRKISSRPATDAAPGHPQITQISRVDF